MKKEAEETVECQEEEKYLVPLKMKKISLLMSFRFWLELFFISFYKIHPSKESKNGKENRNKEEKKNEKENGNKEENKNEKENKREMNCCQKCCFVCLILSIYIIQFFINIALVLCSSLCPIVSNVYMLLLCKPVYFRKFVNEGILLCSVKRIIVFLVGLLIHSVPFIYLYLTFKYSFNIFFYGISYAIQFFLFTLLLAIPRLPTDSLVYVFFITAVATYIYRFVSQFVELYKTLLETILDLRKPT